jgi:hypothetical protein
LYSVKSKLVDTEYLLIVLAVLPFIVVILADGSFVEDSGFSPPYEVETPVTVDSDVWKFYFSSRYGATAFTAGVTVFVVFSHEPTLLQLDLFVKQNYIRDMRWQVEGKVWKVPFILRFKRVMTAVRFQQYLGWMCRECFIIREDFADEAKDNRQG